MSEQAIILFCISGWAMFMFGLAGMLYLLSRLKQNSDEIVRCTNELIRASNGIVKEIVAIQNITIWDNRPKKLSEFK